MASNGDAGGSNGVHAATEKVAAAGGKKSAQGRSGPREADMWLAAYDEPHANLSTMPGCVQLEDLSNDHDYSLVLADMGDMRHNMKLKIYKGTKVSVENALLEVPTAVCTFFMDNNQPMTPAIAVASGAYLYVYRNQRPYFKFTLPSLDVLPREKELWARAHKKEITPYQLQTQLQQLLHEEGEPKLTTRSQKLLGMDAMSYMPDGEDEGLTLDGSQQMQEFVKQVSGGTLRRHTVVTCLDTIRKTSNEADFISCVIIGTESAQVFVLDPEAFTVAQRFDLPSPPTSLHATGTFADDYRIVAGCRNSCVYTLKRGSDRPKYKIELSSPIVALVMVNKRIVVGCMNQMIEAFNLHSKRQWHVQLKVAITTMEVLSYAPLDFAGVLVGLANSEIHVYNGPQLVGMVTLASPPTSMRFGRYGREEGTLVAVTQGGGLHVRILRRDAKLSSKRQQSMAEALESLPGAARKLTLPKKGRQYVLQAVRERDEAEMIYTKYQNDLSQLRFSVVKAYADMLQAGSMPMTMATSSAAGDEGGAETASKNVRLHGEVLGFGPQFRLNLQLKNMSERQHLTHLYIGFHYNDRLYAVTPTHLFVPILVPGVTYRYAVTVECSSDSGQAQSVEVYLFEKKSPRAIVSLSVKMPVSETVIMP